jgi:SNF2 family DNA or RNA helicase
MNAGAEQRIYEKVAHMLLRMKAKDHLEMPELISNKIYVKLPAGVQEQYRKFEKDFLITVLDKTVPAFNRASLGIKCRQIANGFVYHEEMGVREPLPIHDIKLNALEELLEEMLGRPLLLMYEFIEDGQRIMQKFPFAVNITGSKDVMQTVNDFNAGKIPLLIGHPRSAGHGLNLQEACSDICWYGVMWDLELWIQAIARIWRQGQKSPVVKNHIIVAEETTDDAVLEGILAKEATQERVDQALQLYAQKRLG